MAEHLISAPQQDHGTIMQSMLVEDFRKFRREPSAETRAALVERICDLYNENTYKDTERQIVCEILDFLSRDLERSIRATLAEKLKHNRELPHDVAVRLAQDVKEVSMPILQFSALLTDNDLDAIIASSEEVEKLVSIARREKISERISASLVSTEQENVVNTLVQNQGAAIGDEAMERIITVFRDSPTVLESMVKRGGLSATVAEKMISLVSSKLQHELVKHYRLDAKMASSLATEVRGEVTLAKVARYLDKDATLELVNHMFATGRLTASIILRALCQADMLFFEAGIAKLAGIPVPNANILISKGDSTAYARLYEAAHLPGTMLEASEVLLRLIQESPPDTTEGASKAYMAQLMAQFSHSIAERELQGGHYFLTLMKEGAGKPILD